MNHAIFGGSFDPPHKAHLQIMNVVLQNFRIDKLLVLVAYQNPFKSHIRIEPHKRLEWMQKLVQYDSRIECSDYEIIQDKPTTSIQSVQHFSAIYHPNIIYFIIGMDNLMGLPQWNRFDELRQLVNFVVVGRNAIAQCIQKQTCIEFAKKYNLTLHYLDFCHTISSSMIVNDSKKYASEIPDQIRQEVLKILDLPQNSCLKGYI